MGPPAVASVDVRVLGPLEVDVAARPVEVPGRRERAVLTLLAVEVGRPVEVARLGDLLWGSDPPPSADKTLQTFVSRLRHLLGDVPDRLVRRERSYLLDLPTEATDLGRFRASVARAASASSAGRVEDALEALEAALALWRGDHPADLGSTAAALAVVQVIERERGAAVEALVAARLAAGDLEAAVAAAERELAGHPEQEPLWALVMRAHVAGGRPTAALEAYERCRRWLGEELGLDPSPSLAGLHARILRGDPDLLPADGSPDVARLGAAGPSSPPRDPTARRVSPPPALSPLVGRQQELEQLRAALAADRLVTLTGTGGVGKTRLAVEAVLAAAETAWCDLTRVGTDGAVEEAIASAVGVRAPPGDPVLDATVADLSSPAVTLVLDNCEHVLDGVRSAVVAMLRSCPDLTVLTTSRQPLAIAGEHVLPVAPLPTDAGGPAVALFVDAVERAGGRVSEGDDPGLLQRVCERLDGLPLALELAAPMVRTLGLQGVLDGLARRFSLFDVSWDATGRERDLRGTVAWSESLLPPPSRHLLRTVSVFAGPFTSGMVSEVCEPRVADVDTALAGLVDRSLVEPVTGSPRRFRLLENVRAYGRDALGGSALDGLGRRHAEWIAAQCDHVSDRWWEEDEVELSQSLTDVIDEVRAAVVWVTAAGDADRGLRIASGIYGPMLLGVRTDMATWVRELLERFGDAAQHPRLAAAWGARAHWLLLCEEDADAAAAAAARGDAVLGGRPVPPVMWQYRTEAALRAYDVDRAQRLLDEAREAGIPRGWEHFLEATIVPTELALGQHVRVAERVLRLTPAAARTGSLVLRQLFRTAAAFVEHGGEPRRMLTVIREVLEAVSADETRFIAHLMTMTAASYAVRSGDRELATATFQDVLGRWGAVGAWRYEWNTIREVIALLATCGAAEDVVVLDAAARSSATAPGLIGEQLEITDAAVAGARARLPSDVFTAAAGRGAAMTERDALAYAQDALTRLRA